MAVFQLGPIIRNRRVELGLSQEDLADGICSVPTLSRIENSERMPTKNHFEMLMQRLGYSITSLDYFTDRRDFLIHELKFKIRQAYVLKDLSLASKLLGEYRMLLKVDSNVDQQFYLLYHTLLNLDRYSKEEELALLEEALRLTCPTYSVSHIPRILSYEEIILLNNIAVCYDVPETRLYAISILRAVKTYYDRQVINSEEALRTQQMILYNLSKALGMAGYYDECIEVCSESVRLAKRTYRCTCLGEVLYNRAWALVRRNQKGDYAIAANDALFARNFFEIMGNITYVERVERLIKDNNLLQQ